MQKVRYAVAALTVTVAGIGGTKLFEGKGPPVSPGVTAAYVERVAGNQVVTACYGHTRTAVLGMTYKDAECDALLLQDLNTVYAPAVRRLVKVPLSQGEFNALVDFAYNLGVGNLASSTLLKLVNAKQYDLAALEFRKWNRVNGKNCDIPASKCGGIPKRRQWQTQMFVSG